MRANTRSEAGSRHPAERARIPATIRYLLAGNLVSSVGSGLTLPFLLIYLHDVRHIPLSLTGVLIGATAVVGIPAGPLMGALLDRFGARRVCAAAIAVAAAGTAGLILVHSAAVAIPVLAVYGFGESALWPTWNALFAVMVPDHELRPRVFARSFQLLNLGLGAGAMIAGAVVHVSDPESFTLIYAVDGATFLVVMAVLLALPGESLRAPGPAAGDGVGGRSGYREVLCDQRFRRYIFGSAFLAFAGYAAVNAGMVGYATHVVGSPPYVIAWAFGLNTGLIVLAQPLGLRLVGRMRRTTALMCCAAIFGSSWALLLAGGAFPHSALGNGLVVAMFGVFSLGEVLLAPVGAPLVTMLAPAHLQGRYNATATSVYTSLNVVAPSVAGVLLGLGLGNVYLAVVMTSAAVAVFGFARLRHVLAPEIDNARVGIEATGA